MDCIPRYIDDEDNWELMSRHFVEEIKEAVFDMCASSSAGPDGYNGTFYQKCWHIIQEYIVAFVQAFFDGGNLTKYYSHTYLALIPKVEAPSNFSNLRPISLSNYSHKIIFKVMSKRLNPILPRIISENQSNFVKGRSIIDNIFLAKEIVHGIFQKKQRW